LAPVEASVIFEVVNVPEIVTLFPAIVPLNSAFPDESIKNSFECIEPAEFNSIPWFVKLFAYTVGVFPEIAVGVIVHPPT